MKRLIALAALLCAASACTATTENANTGANTNNANAAATATATPAAAGPTQADIEAKERQVWDAMKAKNWDAFAGMLSDDFIIVGDNGVETRAQVLDTIKKYDLTEYSLADVKFVKVDPDLAIITYTATEKSSYDGHPSPGKPARASSAWVNKGGKWVVAYHQETEVGEMTTTPAGGAANSNKAANTNANTTGANSNAPAAANSNASPSASPTAAEAANPIDKEKKVWDELKAKDWTAFATDLADEFIEVEPEGVFTKAASIEGVKQMDASKYTLSDWKETKIDADASIVSYHVKSADGKEGNHATIWAKRGERWWAFLHQGTPVMKK